MILSPLKLPVATKPSNRRNPSRWTLGWLAVRLTGLSKAPPPTKTKTSGLLSNHKPNIDMFLVKLLVFRDFQGCNCQSEFWGFATTDITFPISLVACSEHTCRWTPKNTDRKSGALKNVLCWTCFFWRCSVYSTYTNLHNADKHVHTIVLYDRSTYYTYYSV